MLKVLKQSLAVLFVILPFAVSAQEIALTDEVYTKNNILYTKQNVAFTGILYEYNETIGNDCSCTMQANYTNGLLHGKKRIWYRNNQLKFSGDYINGSADGVHKNLSANNKITRELNYINGKLLWDKTYYNSGNIASLKTYTNKQLTEQKTYYDAINKPLEKKLKYENEHLIYETNYFDNGNLSKEQSYKNKNITQQTLYNNNSNNSVKSSFTKLMEIGLTHYKTYFESGNLKESYFSNNTRQLDSLKVTYNDKKEKMLEEAYYKTKLIREGKYLGNKKQGEWNYISKDGEYQTIKIFNADSLLSEETTKLSHLIKNASFTKNDALLVYTDYFKNEKGYTKYQYVANDRLSNTQHNALKNAIKSQLSQTFLELHNVVSFKNNTLEGYIKIDNADVKYEESSYKRGTNYVKGYDAYISFTISILDSDYITQHTVDVKANNSGKLLTSLLKTAASSFFKTPEDAFKNSIKHLSIERFMLRYFPIIGKIDKVTDQNSKKIKQVQLNIGPSQQVKEGMIFTVNTDQFSKAITLKVESFINNSAIAKVTSGQKELKTLIDTNNPIQVNLTKN